MVLHARIKYRENAIRGLNQHLKNGTFPKGFKALKPYPTMESPQAQAKVNEACQQVHKVMLDERLRDYERKLQDDRASLQSLKDTPRTATTHQDWARRTSVAAVTTGTP